MQHRPVTSALLAPIEEQAMQPPAQYDLTELRRKLEQRMEYAMKVKTLPHDPTMDPDETIPSYASSTEVAERA